jgi:hypothetical protein
MRAHLRPQAVGCSPETLRSRRISFPATRLFGAARSCSYSHESMAKASSRNFALKVPYRALVIEGLGTLTTLGPFLPTVLVPNNAVATIG